MYKRIANLALKKSGKNCSVQIDMDFLSIFQCKCPQKNHTTTEKRSSGYEIINKNSLG